MTHTFHEILTKLSKLSKCDIEYTFGRAGDELWKVLKAYQGLRENGLKGTEAGVKLRELLEKGD